MNDCKSLVESRAFWSALLALTASVATSFHLTALAAWAADGATLDGVMNGLAMMGALGAIIFRYQATARTTSILPPGVGPSAGAGAVGPLALMCLAPATGLLAGCSASQMAGYAQVASTGAGVLKAIGADVARIDCQYGDLVHVVADDLGAAARVRSALARNASLLKDICPNIAAARVNVTAGG
jgi:hypothetical protein